MATATTTWPPLIDPVPTEASPTNLGDYEATRGSFSWGSARRQLAGLPGGGLNIAWEAVGHHAAGRLADKVALRCLGKDGSRQELTFRDLDRLSSRFANALADLGAGRGTRVYVLAGRIPELYAAVLGGLKHGCVVCPLFAAFGPEPIRARLAIGRGEVLVTTAPLYERKISGIRSDLPALQHVILIGEDPVSPGQGIHRWSALTERVRDEYAIPRSAASDLALLHFTSGTTGRPKGAMHVHGAVIAHAATARTALDLRPEDVFWCTADPGWVTGTSYGIIAPLVLGVTSIVDEADFDLERWCSILEREGVSVWYTAPTAIRMMMRAGLEPFRRRRFPHLRFLASVGEPLNPDAVVWGRDAFGHPFHDNWWQTETGSIMIANFAGTEIRPGSMGRPVPGIEAGIVRREGEGVEEIREPGVEGELALRPGWPSMFRGYWEDPDRTTGCFAGGWYLTGDLARRDEDGYYWFVGRSDDVIKTSGHLVGPFEVESVLLAHPAVAEAAVIGKPDPVALEIVKAFVALKPGHAGDDGLRRDLLGFARSRLGAVVAPKELVFVDSLPKTRSGKILRRLLKARELGLPEGDISTLEGMP